VNNDSSTIENISVPESTRSFWILIGGQLFSYFGTSLVGFSLGVWVFQKTGSISDLAILSIVTLLPAIFISPIAGVIADRWPKKASMVAVDTLAIVFSLGVFVLLLNDQLEVWHLYVTAVVDGIAMGMQRPLYESATPLLVRKEKLPHVNGTMQAIVGFIQIICPALAGGLLLIVGLKWIILVDLITFVIAMGCLFSVKVPTLRKEDSEESAANWLQEFISGWNFVKERVGLKALFWFVTLRNFLFATCEVVALPLLLTVTTADKAGLVLSAGGLGVIVGGSIIGYTGGTKRRINGVFIAQAITGCAMILAGLTTNLWIIALAIGIAFIAFPIEDATSTTIIQNKVPLGLLGRVGSVRNMMHLAAIPVAMSIAAPMAEFVFEPLLAEGGPLVDSLGPIVGVGQGRGMALLLIVMGFLTIGLTIAGYFYKPLRNVEEDLPDQLQPEDEDSDELPSDIADGNTASQGGVQ